jgi:hypothetical protein
MGGPGHSLILGRHHFHDVQALVWQDTIRQQYALPMVVQQPHKRSAVDLTGGAMVATGATLPAFLSLWLRVDTV